LVFREEYLLSHRDPAVAELPGPYIRREVETSVATKRRCVIPGRYGSADEVLRRTEFIPFPAIHVERSDG
jgi:hypothetical protein